MTVLDLKKKISRAVTQSNEMDRVCYIIVAGTGQFRIDGNYIVLIKEDGTYHRINKQQLDQDTLWSIH
ncbi:MAG: hypothetical protein HN580_00180 [Deltaproteobacteria bacterium]|nr:hypothetical protein [Deltaproteobacteria bacterium]MBT4641286.1 hypothetical protein [Deltaproteobacteria bacterium]MBT6504256.1 hypothetical protein [Deltaproteobacteria bacterium]MBT7712823.1 hypothetical protein [Deltaproteobacteria bacterium]MBT7887415.1 hypothetical protein [Deltaproteobacteria bacterium]